MRVCGFIRSNRDCLSEWGCVLIYIPIKCCFSSMPHKLLHVVSVHNHCFEFLVEVIYCGYFSKSHRYFSKANVLLPYRGSSRESPGCGAIEHIWSYRAWALTFIAHESRCSHPCSLLYSVTVGHLHYTFKWLFSPHFLRYSRANQLWLSVIFFSIINILISKSRNMNGLFLDIVQSSGSQQFIRDLLDTEFFFVLLFLTDQIF